MTIFYAGQVIVFNDFPADKAKEVMLMASKGSPHNYTPPGTPTLSPAKNAYSPETVKSRVDPGPSRGLPPHHPVNNMIQVCIPGLPEPTGSGNDLILLSVDYGKNYESLSSLLLMFHFPVIADLPIARRNSLHRFLEKRKDR